MTREKAIETCARALLKRRNYPEDQWQNTPKAKDFAEDLVTGLEALGLLKPET